MTEHVKFLRQVSAWPLALGVADRFTAAADELERLENAIPELVKLAGKHGREGHEPSIYRRGNVWRYHVEVAGNEWSDNVDPAKAAEESDS